jgi:thiol-disulfide isomerase/thioredoxin
MADRPALGRLARPARRTGVRGVVVVAAAAAAVAAACSKAPETGVAKAADAGAAHAQIVPVTAAQVGEVVKAARGNVVLLNVWATWCHPCREEFPYLVRLQRELGAQGFELVLVSADFENQLPQVVEFLAGQGVDFRSYRKVGSDAEFIDGLDPRWSGALPATFVYDRSGTLRDFWEGDLSYEGFLERLKPWLNDKAS